MSIFPEKEFTAVILAGGKSSRFGQNKALIKISDETIIERLLKELKKIFSEIILSTNSFDEFEFLNLKMYSDIYKECGPLGGIHSGLMNSQTIKNFIISCDLPFITSEIIQFISQYKTQKQITVTKVNGIIQPLCGVYSKECLPVIEKLLIGDSHIRRKHSVLDLIESCDSEIIELEKEFENYNPKSFWNINTVEEYKLAKKYCRIS
ncbi:MAG: molybdenum cofactor guanylyltransferase [Ignavibacteria bacterium]|nr:molybdenum cofactor guanylyltransferase [Ignavibacteria bacterium]